MKQLAPWLVLAACAGDAPVYMPHVSSDLAQACGGGPTLEGVDVSDAQGDIDWSSAAASGISFAWIKATQGTYYTSSTFGSTWPGARAAGVRRGAYHFFDPTEDGVAQAQHFLATIGPLAPEDLPPMLDMECPDGDSQCLGFAGGSGYEPGSVILARALDWLHTVEAATGKHPIIYSGAFYFPPLGDASALAAYPLWLADPGSNTCTTVPAPWAGIAIRQYDWNGYVPGIAGAVDRDRFFGTADELAALAGASSAAAPNAGGAGEPAVVAAGSDGRLQIFARDGQTLRYNYQQYAEQFTGFVDFGGAIAGKPAIAVDPDGGLALVVRFADDSIAMTRQQGGPHEAWAPWTSLGGVVRSDPTVAVNDDGRLEVFVLGADLALWHAFETTPGGAWSGWSSLGGVQLSSSLHAASDPSGAIVAMVRGGDGHLYEKHQLADRSQWSDWIEVGGDLTTDFAVADDAGALAAFVRGADGALWRATRTGDTWSSWVSLGGMLTSSPSIVADPSGALHAFARGTDNALWTAAEAEGWTWETLGGAETSDPAAAVGVAGQLTSFVRGADSGWYVDVDEGSQWSTWYPF